MSSKVLIAYKGGKAAWLLDKSLPSQDCQFVKTNLSDMPSALVREAPEVVIFISEENSLDNIVQVIEISRTFDDNLPFIVVTGSKNVEDAVSAMRAGAYDYFTIPIDKTKLKNSIANAVKLYALTKRIFLLESQMGMREALDNIVGSNQRMQEIFNTIQSVAKSNATVLILGESGTGKELVAKAVHRHSPRSTKPFVDINCGAIPSELLENEMFGHERGAYTGADRRYISSFERAHGGTIFLDEISEMNPLLQVKLLRFLQERNFTRVGGSEPITVDVRIITATNRDLARMVEEKEFREDLYYRLNVVPISIPPLRDRREDIPLLIRYFLQKISAKNEKIFVNVAANAMEALVAYDWPGNVRELENAIERVVVLNNDSTVKLSHLPTVIKDNMGKGVKRVEKQEFKPFAQHKIIPLDIVERYAIEAALNQCQGSVSDAAAKLKIGQATLYRKIKQYGLR